MKKVFIALFSIFLMSLGAQAHAQTISVDRVLTLVNAERAKAGLSAVVFERRLNEAAGIKARDMAAKTYFDHVSPDGTDPWDLLARVGYDWAWAGENLALNAQTLSEEAIVKAWMDSTGHREIILTESHIQTGIGVATGIYNGQAVVFVSQFFASPKIVEEPKPVAPIEVGPESVAPTAQAGTIQNNIQAKTVEAKPSSAVATSAIYRTTSAAGSIASEIKNINETEEVIASNTIESVESARPQNAETQTKIQTNWKFKLNLFIKKLLAVFVKSAQAFNR